LLTSGKETSLKAILILSDAASSHPDGTFSLLRGGISEINVPKNRPAAFKGALVARITASAAEAGVHEVKVRCINQDGGSIIPDVTAQFNVPDNGGVVHIVMEMAILFPSLGKYEFSIAVDKHEMDTWPIEAKLAKEVKAK